MNINQKPIGGRWAISGLLSVLILLTACVPIGAAPKTTDDRSIQLTDGQVQVKDENGEWIPVAGISTFQMVGELEGADPWIVAGRTLETNDLTQIEEGLEPGDLVRVWGAILEDDTWVAYSIESADEQVDPAITLIGVVDSVDPWVVNGIELDVTGETDIQGEITPGTVVRVEILLLPDGTWQVLSLAPLGNLAETPGCVTVIAKIISLDGDQIQFEGWPAPVTLAEDAQTKINKEGDQDDNENGDDEGNDGITMAPGRTVLAVVCIDEDGRLVIVQLTLLDKEEDDDLGDGNGNEKVLVCHNASKNNPHTISIAEPAVPAHLAHGDTLGPCP